MADRHLVDAGSDLGQMDRAMNWEAAIGSRYRVRCGRWGEITGAQRHGDRLILIGVVDFGAINDDGRKGLVRNWCEGNDLDGDQSFDLMAFISGPGQCAK